MPSSRERLIPPYPSGSSSSSCPRSARRSPTSGATRMPARPASSSGRLTGTASFRSSTTAADPVPEGQRTVAWGWATCVDGRRSSTASLPFTMSSQAGPSWSGGFRSPPRLNTFPWITDEGPRSAGVHRCRLTAGETSGLERGGGSPLDGPGYTAQTGPEGGRASSPWSPLHLSRSSIVLHEIGGR